MGARPRHHVARLGRRQSECGELYSGSTPRDPSLRRRRLAYGFSLDMVAKLTL